FAGPLLHGKPLDWRIGALFATLILYLFFVGHRFSSFYAYTSFLIMPIGVVLLSNRAERAMKSISRYLAIAGAVLSLLIAVAITHSYVVVRGEGAQILSKLFQRIMIQQGEMWWMTYERVFLHGDWNSGLAAYKLFVGPFDQSRNSTMQFLMELGMPVERAHFVLTQGASY